ncbi:MAG: OmpA family protein [Cyclonatronaceae bacterium]
MKLLALLYKVSLLKVLPIILLFALQGCGSSEPAADVTLSEEQQRIREELFQSADARLEHLQSIQADVLSPGYFETGMSHYENAERLLRQGRELDRIREELDMALEAFDEAEETTNLAEVTFRSAIEARNDALEAQAPVFSSDSWLEAEEAFRTAARFLEDGNVNRARSQASTVEEQYQAVELEAIKANYLNAARETLREAESEQAQRNAPKTLAKARSRVEQVEEMLSEDRYDTEEAGQLAKQASYEASHALYLHREINRMRNEDMTFEDLFLRAEEPLEMISDALDIDVRFDSGLQPPAEEIINAFDSQMRDKEARIDAAEEQIRNLRLENERQAEELRQQQSEIAVMREQIDEKGDLATRLEIQQKRDEAVKNVRNLIPPNDGDVFLDGDNVLIRLHGLNFPVGQSTLEPKFFNLLRRVQDAIKLFPEGRVRIEGHTDSSGSLEMNQRLSEDRAEAVAEYIRSNIDMDIPLRSAGFGPERPVASNENEAGRAQNRRIDVVITPGWSDQ